MLTLGKVVDVLTTENKLRVRTPVFETSGDPTQVILTCAVCHDPGSINGYKVDDTVYVTFTDNEFNRPVVLGKLYLGIDNEENSNSLKADSLEVSNSAILPANTKIGQLSLLDLDNNIKKLTTIENVLNNKQNKLVAGSNITLTVNPLDDTVRISSSGGGGGGDAVWGEITRRLSDQADLNARLVGIDSQIASKQNKLTAGTGIDMTNDVISCNLEVENTIPERFSTAYNLVTNLNQYTMPNVKFGTEQSGPGYIYRVFKNSNTDVAITDDTTIKNYLTIMTGNDAIPVYELTDGKATFIYCTADNSFWKLQRNANKQLWAIKVVNRPFASTIDLNNGLNTKQNVLTPGTGISITNDTISSTVIGITDISSETIIFKDLAPGFYRLTYNGNKIMDLSNTETYVYTIANTGIVTLEVWEVSQSGQIRKCAKTHQQDWTKILLFFMDTNATHGYSGGVLNDGSPISYVNWTFVSNIWAPVVNGTSGQILQANGDNNAPTWTSTPTFTSASVTNMGSTDNSVPTKKYVDDLVGQINGILATLVTPE